MACWLVKTEPDEFGFSDLERDGKAAWDGVKNPLARKHIAAMTPGDKVLIYHTGMQKAIVGMATVDSPPYVDPKQKDPHALVIDLKPLKRLSNSIPLQIIKSDQRFAQWELVRMARLSVMPVSTEYWNLLMHMAGE
jgi:predicted RNA-binding protein with PUA-like domain